MCGGKLGNGQSCLGHPPTDCLSGFCINNVCCNSACDGGLCGRCDLASSPGTCAGNVGATDAGCGGYVCKAALACPTGCLVDTDCATGNYCGAGTCKPKLGQGQPCASANQCQATNCVEGVCCSSSCTGGCQTCLHSRGAVADGTCGNVAMGNDPKNVCSQYNCNGSGGCASTCSGSCQATCKPGFVCNVGACTALFANGSACSANCQCNSGICTAFFLDNDMDGYGKADAGLVSFCGTSPPSAFFTLDGTDCCDDDFNAHPNQPLWFSGVRNVCGGYDYNCDGMETPQNTLLSGGNCAPANGDTANCDESCQGGAMIPTPGWMSIIPGCGVTAQFAPGPCSTQPMADAMCPGNTDNPCLPNVVQQPQSCH
jgi:hypothetical protein